MPCSTSRPRESAADVPADVRQTATSEDVVIDWSLEEVTPEYFAEINERRSSELGIKEKYVRKSLQFLISESVKKIAKYDQQLRPIRDENDPKRLSLQGNRAQEEARKAELSHRLKDRLEEIEQESHLSEKPPEVVGVAVILPPPREVVASVEGMESDPEVEAIAIEVVKKYEIEPRPQAGFRRGGELRLGHHLARWTARRTAISRSRAGRASVAWP